MIARAVVTALFGAAAALAQVPAPGTALEPRPVMQEIPRATMPFRELTRQVPAGPCDPARQFVVGDVDRDGDLDVVGGNTYINPPRLYLNDGSGRLTEVTLTHMPPIPTWVNSWRTCLGDIDGDGDLDLVAGTDGRNPPPRRLQGLVLTNDGTGRFTDESMNRLPLHNDYPYQLNDITALADFDGDGDLDVVFGGGLTQGNFDRSIRLLRNDGRGYFTFDPTATPVDQGRSASASGELVEADLDGDGDVDLTGNCIFGGLALWLNDGTGRLVDAKATHVHPQVPGQTMSSRVADLDGDGDLDLILTLPYAPQPPRLYSNDGSGHFYDTSATSIPASSHGGLAAGIGDFDDDGDLDLLNVMYSTSPSAPGEELLLNDGTGRFTLDTSNRIFVPATSSGAYTVTVVDLDADGDDDVLIPDAGARGFPQCRTRLFFNTTRQIWAEQPATRGKPWRVTVAANERSFALLAYATLAAAAVPSPFGALRLDPCVTLVWPAVLATGNDRQTVADLPIPDLPLLQGLPLYAQALVVEPSGRARFSNLWIEPAIQ